MKCIFVYSFSEIWLPGIFSDKTIQCIYNNILVNSIFYVLYISCLYICIYFTIYILCTLYSTLLLYIMFRATVLLILMLVFSFLCQNACQKQPKEEEFCLTVWGTVHHSRGVKGVRQLVIRHLLLERNERQMPTLSLLSPFYSVLDSSLW